MNNLLLRYFGVIFFSISSLSSTVFSQKEISFIDFPAVNLEEVNEIKITIDSDEWQYLLDSLRYNGDEFLAIKSFESNGFSYGSWFIDEFGNS